MIDSDARRQARELLRHLLSGQITSDEFEDRFPRQSKDPGVSQVRWAAWHLYSDDREYRLVGKHRLTGMTRREISRWIVFLHTELEYEWPIINVWLEVALAPLNMITFGFVGRLLQLRLARLGHFDVWPFIRRADYEAAIAHPRYLNEENP